MPLKSHPKIALIGNPNSGKSSLFNHLTGLNQKVGNFPGVTVEKKTGRCQLNDHILADITDLPGTYSIYPRSLDERVVFDVINNPKTAPDIAVVIVDISNIKRNLLLFTQIRDLGIPVILALNMMDVAKRAGMKINMEKLKKDLDVQVVVINARKGEGIDDLKFLLCNPVLKPAKNILDVYNLAPEVIIAIKDRFKICNNYSAYQLAQQYEFISTLTPDDKKFIAETKNLYNFDDKALQAKETIARYEVINKLVQRSIPGYLEESKNDLTRKLDKIFTHKIFGYASFFLILFLIFQAIFSWAQIPMDFIDASFSNLSSWVASMFPPGPLTDLLAEGIIPGLGGILIFVPQIALLFAFISILEESGYMARVVFLMDKVMRKFGLNGKSVVPLISGVACAIPAIMATRNIENYKDRLITIFVTPLMSCSARLPIYTILISLVVPDELVFGLLNLQGIALMGMYLLGFLAAIFSAYLLKLIMKVRERSFFIMELPLYKTPRWKNVGYTIVEKVKAFVFEAGKIIMAISVILWVLASYGPGDTMEKARATISANIDVNTLTEEQYTNLVEAYKLEHSYAGIFGKTIEPVLRPLGFDWKIGIAIITSFAAREVFVGTMATIYSIGSDVTDDQTIKERMKNEIDAETGTAFYTPALALSLLVFYAFAMQCMSTLAVVRRETKSWKWPIIQFIYLSGLAYVSSFIVYNLFS